MIVTSSDTDVLACLIYHTAKWINCYKVNILWVIRGISTTRKVTPIDVLLHDIGIHSALVLTGCDT